jgi:lipopolysaccharide/colanic/teichoic acid biosynthesis glycosyltransferase
MIRLFRVFIPVGTVTLLISEILLVTASFVIACYLVFQADPTDYLLYDGGMTRIVMVLLCILVGLHFHDLYSQIYVKSRLVLFQQLCLVIGIAFLLQGFISYVDRELRMPVRIMVVGSFLSLALIFIWRTIFSAYALQVVGSDRLLLVGGSPVLEDIARYIVHATNPNRIVVGMFERRNRVPVAELLDLRFGGHIIEEAGSAYERICGRVCIKELRPSQLIYSGELGPSRQTLLYQTLAHTALATVGVIVASPLMLLTAIAVRLSSAGPVLYRQVRVGMDGVNFTLYKFRSMRVDAEAGTGAVWATRDDPRITGVGRIIRRLRFDELPQLFNVLKGEMALVGPRPERPEFVKALSEHIPYYRQRHCVRPGITGWAQVSYKYGDTLQDTITKLEYDLYYIKNMSLSLDGYIIFHTIKAMLLSRGAQ